MKRQRPVEGVLRTFKIRMVPTPEQRQELRLAFAVARLAYNWAVAQVNAGAKANFLALRKLFFEQPLPNWAVDDKKRPHVHNKVVARAIKQACDAFETNWKKWRKNSTHRFHVRFRSLRKSLTEVVVLERRGNAGPLLRYEAKDSKHRDGRPECAVHLGGNFKRSGPIRLQDKEKVIQRLVSEANDPKEDAKILWDKRTGAYYLVYLFEQPRPAPDPDPEFQSKRIVAGDAGVRNFLSFGSPTDGRHGEVLVGMREQLYDRCALLDALHSRIEKRRTRTTSSSARTTRQRYETTRRLRRKLARERRRLHNWVEAAHYDAANFLLSRYDILVLPHLQVAAMVPNERRVFSSQVARSMLTMSHGMFTARLKSAASRYSGRYVIADTGEPGTSKTCTNCGFWHSDLGGSKTFKCPRCTICVDRDVNGWRGNLFAAYGKAVNVGWDGKYG